MSKRFTINDSPAAGLRGKKIVLAGFGNQGAAHAECLRDEGVDLTIGLRRDGASWNLARDKGYAVLELSEAAALADILLLLTPDETQAELYERTIKTHLHDGAALGFAHGFAVGFGHLQPKPGIDVFLVAPKAQGLKVRKLYKEGRGAAALVAVEQDATGRAWSTTLAYAAALGCLRTGALETTFREEAVSDLFGEQAVLCGGMSELIRAAFDTLVARGYSPDVAYFECLHEVKIIADLMHSRGIDGMRRVISGTALYGDTTRGKRVIDSHVRETMSDMLTEIESGDFAREWIEEHCAGRPRLGRILADDAGHPIEEAGRRVRNLMPWLEEDE
ncbi:MAG: ketol-acid reductoisomerase [bacterium]|nr:ketol-acid reductoisomerase [bacterium]